MLKTSRRYSWYWYTLIFESKTTKLNDKIIRMALIQLNSMNLISHIMWVQFVNWPFLISIRIKINLAHNELTLSLLTCNHSEHWAQLYSEEATEQWQMAMHTMYNSISCARSTLSLTKFRNNNKDIYHNLW